MNIFEKTFAKHKSLVLEHFGIREDLRNPDETTVKTQVAKLAPIFFGKDAKMHPEGIGHDDNTWTFPFLNKDGAQHVGTLYCSSGRWFSEYAVGVKPLSSAISPRYSAVPDSILKSVGIENPDVYTTGGQIQST